MSGASAVVFAYHNVGVRCLSVLLAAGVDVRLVVTHEDNPGETIWFASVRRLCEENDIPVITPADPNTPEVEARVTTSSVSGAGSEAPELAANRTSGCGCGAAAAASASVSGCGSVV